MRTPAPAVNRRSFSGPPRRSPRARRARAVVLGGLVAAAVASVVLGPGWAVVRGGGGAGSASSGAAAGAKQDGGELSPSGYVACARLIVEGTVTGVVPEPGTGQDRISLAVDRYYKPASGGGRVGFVMDHDVSPRLRKGQHVLVGIPRNAAGPDIWTVGEKEIAHDRAWILEALRAGGTGECPSG